MRVMVWGAIANDSKPRLVFISGRMIAQRYIHEVLWPYLFLFSETLDNARLYVARVTFEFLKNYVVNLLLWPLISRHLSPIEHACDMMTRMFQNLPYPPQTYPIPRRHRSPYSINA